MSIANLHRQNRIIMSDSDAATNPPVETLARTPKSRSIERKWLVFILSLYCVFAGFFAAFTPIGEGPDELDHIRYVEYLVRYGDFPSVGNGTATPYTLEAKQPPAYYLINAGAMLLLGRAGKTIAPALLHDALFGTDAHHVQWYIHGPVEPDLLPWTYIMRALGIVMGAGTVLLVFASGREVFPDESHAPLALCAAALTGLLPQFIFVSAVVNNDNFATLTGAALAYSLLRFISRGPSLRGALVLGVLLGLALLSKMNNLLCIPIVMLVLALPHSYIAARKTPLEDRIVRHKLEPAKYLRRLITLSVIVLGAGVLVGGWWYLRNWIQYGDAFAARAVNLMATRVIPTHTSADFDWRDPGSLLVQLVTVMSTHFGAFGWVTIKPPAIMYLVYMALISFSVVGLVVQFVRSELTRTQRVQLLVSVVVLALFYASMIYNVVGQGRLLYPVITYTSLLASVGTYGFINVAARRHTVRNNTVVTAALWTSFLALSSAYCLFVVVIPAFG